MLNPTMLAMSGIFSRLFADQSEQSMNAPSTGVIIACVVSAVVIALVISFVYMFTRRKTGYTQSLVLTMPMLAGTVSAVMILMCLLSYTTATAAAISLTGAFSLIRFRSAPGDPRDIAYIFFAMTVGVICGVGYVGYAALIALLLCGVLVILELTGIASPKVQDMTLKITIPENLNYNGLFDDVLKKYTNNYLLRRVKTTDFGTLFDLVYSIRVDSGTDQKKFIDEIRALNGNLNVTLVLYKYDDQIYDSKK